MEFDSSVTQAEALVEAVEDCGFDASLLEVKGGGKQEGRTQVGVI